MRILYDNQIYVVQKYGGISRYFNELKKSQPLDYIVLQQEKESIQIVKKKDNFRSRINRILKKKSNRGILEANEHLISSQKGKEEFDIFHPTYYDTDFLTWLNKPFVLTVHDMIYELFPEIFRPNQVSINKKLLCEKASAIITVSLKTKTDLVEIFDIDPNRITVIYLASDFKEKTAIPPHDFELPSNFILYTGQRGHYKNFPLFLRAVAPILKNTDLFLVCTGHSFSLEEITFIEMLNVSDKVKQTYIKKDEELLFLYQRATCFVLPSLYEGFGLPLLEAFAAGCPVICSDCGSLPEIAGNSALYFSPKSVKEIREAVLTVIHDKRIRVKLIENGKIRYNDFSWAKCRKETKEVYNSVLNK